MCQLLKIYNEVLVSLAALQFSFINQYSVPLPPVLSALNIQEIENQLINLSTDKNLYDEISHSSKEWFNDNCGIGLADKIIKNNF